MSLSSLSINRPVLATVFSILIVLFGVIGFFFLGIREYPSVDPPVITVSTTYTGANSDIIESQITEPLEEAINGIAGIKSLSSTSTDGRSTITVEFELGVDMEAAANDVRDKVSGAIRNLPPDVDPPRVAKSDANASPILMLTVQSDSRNLLELSEIGNNIFKERLQTIPGVSEVSIWGEKRYAMRLWLDPAKLSAYNLTPMDVRNALNSENVELPSGRIEGTSTELTIRTLGRLQTEEDFNNLIIKEIDGRAIKFSDIGRAELGPENERTAMRGNGGVPMIAVVLTPQPGANHISIANEFYKRIEQIKKDIPDDIHLGIGLDTTIGIRKAIKEVEETIFIAFGLVVLVIFVFLRRFRTTLIPIIAIPISLISAFFIMYLAGFSINILTLLGIVLATGLVVDDAIVVLENIYKKIERGMNPIEAGHKGSSEIFFAIISTTIVLSAVFLPIMFLSGLVGRLFREFAVVVAGSVIVSAFVSLTLTSMMSARLLSHKKREGWFYSKTEMFFENLINGYSKSLHSFVNVRWLAIIIMLISVAIIFGLGRLIPSELAPMEDKSRIVIRATAPEGSSFEYMDNYMSKLVQVVDKIPEKDVLVSVTAGGFGSTGVNSGFIRMVLVSPEERKRTQMQIADSLSEVVKKYSDARSIVMQEQTIAATRGIGLPVQYVIQAPNLEKLRAVLPKFIDEANKNPTFQVVDLNLKFNKPELRIEIDRERARALGVSVLDVAQTLQLYFSGQRMGFFIMNGKQYQVIGQATRDNRDEPLDLKSVFVRNNKGELIQLDNLVNIYEQSNPPQLYRYNRYVSATVSAGLAKGKTLGQGIDEMDKIAGKVLDETFTTSLTGTSQQFKESSSTLLFAFLLALVLIYLILSAQFESFIDPLIIMFTVPLALAGAVLSLWLLNQTMNIFSQIGIIVLVGIVTKNGILIVEFANQRKEQGLSIKEAVLDSAVSRFRPILMTSLSTTLGALPIALSIGASSKSRVPLGITIIGGLLFSLVLTLYVIPALYTYLSREKRKVSV